MLRVRKILTVSSARPNVPNTPAQYLVLAFSSKTAPGGGDYGGFWGPAARSEAIRPGAGRGRTGDHVGRDRKAQGGAGFRI